MKYLLTVLALISPLLFGGFTDASQPQFTAKASTLSPISTPGSPNTPVIVREVSSPTSVSNGHAVNLLQSLGSAGYVMAGNNCVVCVRQLTGRGQIGNAGTWRSSSSAPWIGAIMIFYPGEQGASWAGHVGVVTGIRGGRISLAHCNWSGQTEFYSTGKFY